MRLWGIDAPEYQQTCLVNALPYSCGLAAKEKLIDIIGSKDIECRSKYTDQYSRKIVQCSNDGKDIGSLMVQSGYAFDFKRYSKGFYAADEDTARKAKNGLWRGRFIKPWEWRYKN